ncbi:MAG TPA: BON domain-containing protein [Steroidobacteraceae bacterium]|nr:BON domain-containing protein [Steroidobacteraceae bacterium]
MRRWSPCWILSLGIALAIVTAGCASTQCASGGCVGDDQLTAAVQAQLKQHPALAPPNHVYVKAHNGTVYLSGQVATDLQRQEAEEAARKAPGVTTVVNTIALMYGAR